MKNFFRAGVLFTSFRPKRLRCFRGRILLENRVFRLWVMKIREKMSFFLWLWNSFKKLEFPGSFWLRREFFSRLWIVLQSLMARL